MLQDFIDLPWECDTPYGRQNVWGYIPYPQWPIKLMRIAANAPYFHQAHLLLAADCTAFAYKNFHGNILSGKVPVICCPAENLDAIGEKLFEIIRINELRSITIVRMDAPCCSKLTELVMDYLKHADKDIPLRITTVFVEGEVVE